MTHHTHGVVRGRIETRRFFQEQIPYTVPGVSRHATNPIVDPDEVIVRDDGVVVRYHTLVRCSQRHRRGQGRREPHGYARILGVYSAMTDRLRRSDGGWRIFERRVGPTSMNDGLTPGGASNSGCMDW